MKKLITVVLILAMLIPAVALADYSPKLGMTLDDFVNKYNSVSAPLGSPYTKLDKPIAWTKFNDYDVAWFSPVSNSSVTILLLSKEENPLHVMTGGLDSVQVFIKGDEDFIDLISVTARCSELFSQNILGISVGEMRIVQLIRYYYESNFKGTEGFAYYSINEDNTISLQFFKYSGLYYFCIGATEDME